MQPFVIESKKDLIAEKYCHIEKQKVIFPNGTTGDWYIHKNNDAIIILPQDKEGRVLLQRQYKHGSARVVIEFCAGLIETNEKPLEAAKRELLEETGFSAEKWKPLGTCFANPTGSPMQYHFFLAQDIIKASKQNLESAEQIEVFWAENLSSAKKILLDPKTHTSAGALALLSFLQD